MNMEVTLLHWNANGLRAHCSELKNLLATLTPAPDIICIQETFLKPKATFTLMGYCIERRDRLTAGRGGLATFIRESLPYTVIDTTTSGVEVLTIEVTATTGVMTISNVYNPPRNDINVAEYQQILGRGNTVVVGDFNSQSTLWGSAQTDRNGEVLEGLLDDYGLVSLNTGDGTFIKQQGDCSHPDLTIVSGRLAAKSSWTVINDSLGSDHLPILVTLNERMSHQPSQRVTWAMKRADWTAFGASCDESLSPVETDETAEEHYHRFTNAVLRAANDAIPKRKPRRVGRTVPFWNQRCSDAVRDRNRARNRMNRTRLLADCIEYRRLKGVVQRVIKDESKTHWETYCSHLTTSTKLGTVWRMAKRMSGGNVNHTTPSLRVNGGLLQSNEETAEAFAIHYAAMSSDGNYSAEVYARKAAASEEWRDESAAAQLDTNTPLNDDFTLHELNRAIDCSKAHSAPGMDLISYEMIHHLPGTARNQLLQIYNKLWKNGKLIPEWKQSLVIPIPKTAADKSKPESYRPIALTAVLCKLLERLVVNRLQWFVEKNKLLNPLQSGFRKQRSTTDHVVRLQDCALKSISTGQYTLAVLLDFSKAYDMVWKDGLLFKLRRMGVCGRMYNWIRDFLSDRTIRVRVGDSLSGEYRMENGTPQGSVISPLLFNIMINDLPSPMDAKTLSSIFADDSATWRSGRNLKLLNDKLQHHLDRVSEWSQQWGFKLSETKTVAILFTRSHRVDESAITLSINGTPLKVEKTAKFLGVVFDRQLTWKPHITHVTDKAKKVTNLLRNVSGQTWGASKKSLLTIYRTLIRSRIEFGCEVYHTAPKSQLKRLDTMQSQCLRRCCGAFCSTAVCALQQECGEMPMGLRRQRAQLRYAARILTNAANPAAAVFRESWETGRSRYGVDASRTLHSICADYVADTPFRATATPTLPHPPWCTQPPSVDISLSTEICKQTDAPHVMKQRALFLIESYSESLQIYTDASRQTDDVAAAAAAFYVPELGYSEAVRLPDGTGIYLAELTAVQLALSWLSTLMSMAHTTATVLMDSLSAAKSIRAQTSNTRPQALVDLLQTLSKVKLRVTFVWIPSHVGISGNDAVDELAQAATRHDTVERATTHELHDDYNNIDKHITRLWQREYDSQHTGLFYREIEPVVTAKVKFTANNRAKETLITRLRFGKCKLNSCLHQIGKHPNGLCDACRTPETVRHVLMECAANNVPQQLAATCRQHNLPWTPQTILSDERTMEKAFRLLAALHRSL